MPRRRAISTVRSRDPSSTRMTSSTCVFGTSAYVRSRVASALYAGMTTATLLRAAARSWPGSDATARQHDRQRAQEDRQVEEERPVVQVGEIVAQLDVGLARVLPGDLGEAGQPRARGVSESVSRNRPDEPLGELG